MRDDIPPSDFAESDSALLQSLIDEGKRELPNSAQLRRVAGGLGPILGGSALLGASSATGAGSAAGATSASASGKLATTTLAKIAGVTALAGAVIGGTVWTATRESKAPIEQSASASAAPRSVAPPTVHASPRTLDQAHGPDEASTERITPPSNAITPPDDVKGPSEAPKAPTPRAVQPGPDEATLLRGAQSSMKSDPQRALALTREHRRRFPRGVLAQEREVLAIEALARLGKSSEATERARNFNQRYPGSAHSKKIESATKPVD
jgi:hypothetical protein